MRNILSAATCLPDLGISESRRSERPKKLLSVCLLHINLLEVDVNAHILVVYDHFLLNADHPPSTPMSIFAISTSENRNSKRGCYLLVSKHCLVMGVLKPKGNASNSNSPALSTGPQGP